MRRKPNIEPKQRKISVQDVRDLTTPQGTAMLNDELKRIQLAIEQKPQEKEKVTATPSVAYEQSKEQPKPLVTEKPKEWALTVRGNKLIVPPSKLVQVLDFIDTDTVSFTIRNKPANRADATIENGRVIEIEAQATSSQDAYDDCGVKVEDDLFKYTELVGTEITKEEINKSLKYEFVEHDTYTVSSGIETVPTTEEISFRQPQYNNFLNYPNANNGDGWIPVKADTKIYDNLTGALIIPSFNYEDPSVAGALSRNAFMFTAPKEGIYRIKANVYLRIVADEAAVGVSPKDYDSIDKGMLLLEKSDPANLMISPRNPLTDYTTNLDYIYDIVDMKTRIGDVDGTRSLGQYNSDLDNDLTNPFDWMVPSQRYPNTFYYSSGGMGTPYGAIYSRDINLNGFVDVYMAEGEAIMLWYKIYTRRLHFIASDHYEDRYQSRSAGTSGSTSTDQICFIEDRMENIDIQYLRAESIVSTKSSIRNIVERF